MEEAPQAPWVSVGPGDHQGGGQRRTAPCRMWPPPLTPLWEQCLRCSATAGGGGTPRPPWLCPLPARRCCGALPRKAAVKQPCAGYETFPGEIKPNHLSVSPYLLWHQRLVTNRARKCTAGWNPLCLLLPSPLTRAFAQALEQGRISQNTNGEERKRCGICSVTGRGPGVGRAESGDAGTPGCSPAAAGMRSWHRATPGHPRVLHHAPVPGARGCFFHPVA